MRFETFNKLFKEKYPDGEATMHGKFGGTERNNKVVINFNPNGKCYEYYGSYENILNRVGIKVITKWHFQEIKNILEVYKKRHGNLGLFGNPLDYSREIQYYQTMVDEISESYRVIG